MNTSPNFSKFGCSTCRVISINTYSHMRQQFCGVNDYCDARGSIYPKIKIMVVWRQIHHAGHTPPRNHDLPHWCDFPDVALISMSIVRTRFSFQDASLIRSDDVPHALCNQHDVWQCSHEEIKSQDRLTAATCTKRSLRLSPARLGARDLVQRRAKSFCAHPTLSPVPLGARNQFQRSANVGAHGYHKLRRRVVLSLQ